MQSVAQRLALECHAAHESRSVRASDRRGEVRAEANRIASHRIVRHRDMPPPTLSRSTSRSAHRRSLWTALHDCTVCCVGVAAHRTGWQAQLMGVAGRRTARHPPWRLAAICHQPLPFALSASSFVPATPPLAPPCQIVLLLLLQAPAPVEVQPQSQALPAKLALTRSTRPAAGAVSKRE